MRNVSIERVIKNMSIRPGMYIYPITVGSIMNFLIGVEYCQRSQNPDHKFDFACGNCVTDIIKGTS